MSVLDFFRRKNNAVDSSLGYYEMETGFSTKWVSLDYDGSTAKRIKRMVIGEPIYLEWSDAEFREGEHVRVLDRYRNQIGWVPNNSPGDKLFDAVQKGWPIDARVKRRGKVSDPATNIWWCVVSVKFKIPYPPTEECVYMALNHYRFHRDPNCGKAVKEKVPLSIAEYLGKVPCPKCACTDKEDT